MTISHASSNDFCGEKPSHRVVTKIIPKREIPGNNAIACANPNKKASEIVKVARHDGRHQYNDTNKQDVMKKLKGSIVYA